MAKSNPIDQTRLAVAALAACFIKALSEGDRALAARFEENLEKVYKDIRGNELSHLGALETLNWTREFLKKL